MTISPYGGTLVDRTVPSGLAPGLEAEASRPTDEASGRADDLRAEAEELPSVRLPYRILSDLYLVSVGALSPLRGFMGRDAYRSVLEEMRLPGRPAGAAGGASDEAGPADEAAGAAGALDRAGLPWAVPIVLPADEEEADRLAGADRAALLAPDGEVAGVIDVEEVFEAEPEREAEAVYGTGDRAHPGVAALHELGAAYVGGPVEYLYGEDISGFPEAHLAPAETRARFEERGWRTVVAFQTRNPIHRAHEYIQKCALELVDGLLVHPLVGETKPDDVPADVRMECYRVILENHFPADRVLLSVLPAAMRYAGPREAVHHAIMRRNYGCTHFIVGRDHAGVGDYYGTYDAQEIFDEIDAETLGIRPMKFEHAFWCELTGQMATSKTSPAGPEDQIYLSGTKVREMLSRGERPPEEFSRPEVADVLVRAYREEGEGGGEEEGEGEGEGERGGEGEGAGGEREPDREDAPAESVS